METWRDREEFFWKMNEWSARIGVQRPVLTWEEMSNKWATMRTGHHPVLTVSPELLSLPKELGEFVIVHELVHLLAPGHGVLFKQFMNAYLPEWLQLEQELQKHAHHPIIHERARHDFGWIEFGYISASMYKYRNPGIDDDGIGVAIEMQHQFKMDQRQRKAFMAGWKEYLRVRKIKKEGNSL